MIVTCPRCFSADDVTYQYRCVNTSAHPEHLWLATLRSVTFADDSPDGVTDELLDPLSHCVVDGEPFMEYGVVEHRLRARYPELFAAHVAERGHSMFGTRPATASSVRFGVALGRLERDGKLVSRYGPATGAWSHNERVTYWAKRGPEPDGSLTWVEYCAQLGRDPEWTEDDRCGLRFPG